MNSEAEGGPPHLSVGVADIRRQVGTRMPVERSIEAHGLTLPDAGVPDGAGVRIDGEIESTFDGVVLTGVVTVPWQGTCRRCLQLVSGEATVEVREVYSTAPIDGETWPLEGDHVDLGPLLHDSALLALPLAPLCGPDCAGPDPDRFPAGVNDDDSAEEPPRDPRWAALDDLDL